MLLGEMLIKIGVDATSVQTGLNSAQQTLDGTMGKMLEAGKSLRSAGAAITTGLSVPLQEGIQTVMDTAMEFDKAMDSIRAKTGAGTDAMKSLEDSFNKVFETVPTSMQDLADVMTIVYRATGETGVGLEDLTTQMLRLADLTGTEAVPMAEELVQAFKAWKIDSADAGTTMDFLFNVSQKTGVSIDELSNAISQSAGVFQSYGMNVEQAASMFGLMSAEGVKAEGVLAGLRNFSAKHSVEVTALSTGYEQFRVAVMNATTSEEAMTAGMKILGEAMGENWVKSSVEAIRAGEDVNITLDSTEEAFYKVIAAIKGASTESEATAIAVEAFGTKIGVEMGAAIRSGRADVEDFITELKGAPDTIKDATDATMSYADRMQLLQQRIEMATVPLGESFMEAIEDLMPLLIDIVDVLKDIVSWFSDLDPTVQKIIIAVVGFGAVLGPMLTMLGSLLMVLPALMTGLAGLWGSIYAGATALWTFQIAGGPILWIIEAIIVAAVLLWLYWDEIAAALEDIWNGIKDVFEAVFNAILDVAEFIWDAIMAAAKMWWDLISNTILLPIKLIYENWEAIWDSILAAGEFVWEMIMNAAELWWDLIKFTIIDPIKAVWDFFVEAWDAIVSTLEGAWDFITGLAETVAGVWYDLMIQPFVDAIDFIMDLWNDLYDFLSGLWEDLMSAFETIWDTLIEVAKAPINILIEAFNFVIRALNKIKVEIPDWIPGIGGKKFGIDIPEIPKLATGGIVMTEGLYHLAEGDKPEVVYPLDQLQEDMATTNSQTVYNVTNHNEILVEASPDPELTAEHVVKKISRLTGVRF